jgi:predicted dehydrogenase
MNAVVRIGIAGAGLIGRKHIELIDASRVCVLAGIADPSLDAKAFAEARTTPWYPDCLSLLDGARPDAEIVAWPNAMHLSMTLDCVERGVPVPVEKPVTDTVASAQRLLGEVRRTGVAVLVGHLWLLKKPDDYFEVAWRREPGGGPVLINLVHDIDNLRFICGEIAEVQAIVSNKVRKFAVEDTAGLLLKFANGAIGTFSVSDTTPAPWSWELSSGENTAYPRQNQPCYFFAGTKGSLAVPTMQSWSYPGQDGWYAPLTCTEMKAASIDPLVEQLRHFLAVIARRETPLISVEDAMDTLAVVDAVREAARTGAGVSPRKIPE